MINDDSCLQLSECIVTFLLTWSLLCAHGDELVDTVCHRSVDTEDQHLQTERLANKTVCVRRVKTNLVTEQQLPTGS